MMMKEMVQTKSEMKSHPRSLQPPQTESLTLHLLLMSGAVRSWIGSSPPRSSSSCLALRVRAA